MTLEHKGVSQLLVRSADDHIHVADFSDIAIQTVSEESKREAIGAFLTKHHLTPLSEEEAATHGYSNKLSFHKRPERPFPPPQKIRLHHR